MKENRNIYQKAPFVVKILVLFKTMTRNLIFRGFFKKQHILYQMKIILEKFSYCNTFVKRQTFINVKYSERKV